jgi:ABC-2 type transport system ATP-binding protein
VWRESTERVVRDLHAHRLSKHFSGVRVVKDVEFTLRPGEIIGYLGPNGSGKTTTARMVAGLLEPSSGYVEYGGRRISADLVAYRRELGYIPEEPYLYPFLSGTEYLQLVGRLREIPEQLLTTKIERFLDLFNLRAAADQSISSYSKGMRQKIVISAALMHDPAVVLFDEPETGLDVTTTLMLRHLVRTLAARGKAILYSSLEGVFSQLVIREDPEALARELADLSALGE